MIALLRGELYARQAIARGDDMCYMVVIPSIRLYRFEVANISMPSWLDVVSNESSWASCSACWFEFW